MEQLNHENTINTENKFPIAIVGGELRTPQNIGMCIRVAEAFGVSDFYMHQDSPTITNRTVQRTARNTEKKANITIYNNISNTLNILKEEGYTLLALEITDQSKNVQYYNFTEHTKIALIIGSERFGIPKEALNLCKTSVFIPMYGQNSSMNVVNSLSVVLYEITKQLNNKLNTTLKF